MTNPINIREASREHMQASLAGFETWIAVKLLDYSDAQLFDLFDEAMDAGNCFEVPVILRELVRRRVAGGCDERT